MVYFLIFFILFKLSLTSLNFLSLYFLLSFAMVLTLIFYQMKNFLSLVFILIYVGALLVILFFIFSFQKKLMNSSFSSVYFFMFFSAYAKFYKFKYSESMKDSFMKSFEMSYFLILFSWVLFSLLLLEKLSLEFQGALRSIL